MQPSPLRGPGMLIPAEPPRTRSAARRKWLLRWLALAVAGVVLAGLIMFVAGDWVVMPLVTRGSTVRVPDLYELDVAIAKQALMDSGLVFLNDSTDHLWDEDVPANHVIKQDPLPYAGVKEGRSIRVTISRGPQLYPIPDVKNISPLQAKLRLQQQFFDIGRVTYELRTNDDRSEPFVKEQYPSSGSLVPRGSKVSLEVSIMPQMPDLTGRSVDEARQYVQLLGLVVGSTRYEQSDDLLPRSVVGQSIPPGRRISVGDRVDLVVSHM